MPIKGELHIKTTKASRWKCSVNQVIRFVIRIDPESSSAKHPLLLNSSFRVLAEMQAAITRCHAICGLPMECLVDFGLLNTNRGGLTSKRYCKTVFQRFAGSWHLNLECVSSRWVACRSKLLNESDHTDELRCLIKVDRARAALVTSSRIVQTTGLGNHPGLLSGNMLALHAAKRFLQSRQTWAKTLCVGVDYNNTQSNSNSRQDSRKLFALRSFQGKGQKWLTLQVHARQGVEPCHFLKLGFLLSSQVPFALFTRRKGIILETRLCLGGSSSP